MPENRGRTLQDLMLACQTALRSERHLGLEFEFRHCDVTVIYLNNSYYGSHIDFSRLKNLITRDQIVKSCTLHFWSYFEDYIAVLGLTIVTCTPTLNNIRVVLSNGLRLVFRYSKAHHELLIEEISSRYGNKRIMNLLHAEPHLLEMESMGFTFIQYLKHGGFLSVPGLENRRFTDLLMQCTTKESHSSITGTILGFQFKDWYMEFFYDEKLQFTGENMKFIGEHGREDREERQQDNDFYSWGDFQVFARHNDIQIIEQCRSLDVMIVFLDTGANVHFNYSDELGDYAVSVVEGDGMRFRDSYRRIYKD
ncbi:hypothetical protein MHH28_06195 [Paenibacillus sp. FSL K6-1217]|uniref:hypothetical protein n=1 Tax=Paenibacillus sp. FSL K6-1217 TaxID=2921466 RepID=UPI0032560A85